MDGRATVGSETKLLSNLVHNRIHSPQQPVAGLVNDVEEMLCGFQLKPFLVQLNSSEINYSF